MTGGGTDSARPPEGIGRVGRCRRTAAIPRRPELPIIIVIEPEDPPNIVLTVLLREEAARIARLAAC
jgi:hypothetical protein